MEQQHKAICLQLKADRGSYADQSELLADCAKFGASYIVAEWLDRYCADRGLYTGKKGGEKWNF